MFIIDFNYIHSTQQLHGFLWLYDFNENILMTIIT